MINTTTYNRSANDGISNYYTKIDNRLIKSNQLSYVSKAIMLFILSQDDSFKIIKEYIQRELKIGKRIFNKAWNELKVLGYIKDLGQIKERGKFGAKQWTINEHPENDSNFSHTMGTLHSDNTLTDDTKWAIDNHTSNNNQEINKQLNNDQTNKTISNEFSSPYQPLTTKQIIIKTRFKDIDAPSWNNIDKTLYHHINQNIDKNELKLVFTVYGYLLHINQTYFPKSNVRKWKLNEEDFWKLDSFCNELPLRDFSHLLEVMDKIIENGLNNEKLNYISVSYLTSNVRFNKA